MQNNEMLIKRFYEAFNKKDFVTMQSCYHAEASFSDPVFKSLNSAGAKAMWAMLITSAKDLRVEVTNVKVNGGSGECQWHAWYTFSGTGRKVHNIVHASFKFHDGLIIAHHDHFDFWRWSRSALGPVGIFLGWTLWLKRKVQRDAREKLDRYMKRMQPEAKP